MPIKTGRPSKLTPELTERIARLVRVGNYIEVAAATEGISKDTLYNWLRKGARAKAGIKKQFSDAIQKAVADSETRDVLIIAKAAEKQWQASAWRLERKHPAKWGQRSFMHQQVSGPDGQPIRVDSTTKQEFDYDGFTKLAAAVLGLPPSNGVAQLTDSTHPDDEARIVPEPPVP